MGQAKSNSTGRSGPGLAAPGARRRLLALWRRRPVRVTLAVASVVCVGLVVLVAVGPSSVRDLRVSPGSGAAAGAAQVGTGETAKGVAVSTFPDQSNPPAVALAGSGLGPGHGAYDALACTSAAVCVAVGVDADGLGVVALTGNGGRSWSAPSLPASIPALDAVACGDADHCVAVGRGVIVNSSDGGATWSVQDPPAANTTLLGVACESSQCLATGVSPNPGGPYAPKMLRSGDSGATWAAVELQGGVLGLGSVACPTPSFCVAVGASLMVSGDGGQDWAPRSVAGGVAPLSSVSCSSPTDCVAVGPNPEGVLDGSLSGIAIETVDGGQSWVKESLPADTASVQTVSCSPLGACTASGPGGTAGSPAPLVEQAGPVSAWVAAPPPAGFTNVTALSCVSSTSCVAVGLAGNQPSTALLNGGLWTTTAVAA